MDLPDQHSSPTHFFKLLALFLFILLPLIGFYLGMIYQKSLTPHTLTLNPIIASVSPGISDDSPGVCTQDAKQCPDGSYVSRTGPDCHFETCPTTIPTPMLTPITHTNTTGVWKIYTNTLHHYSLQYPPGWTIDTTKANNFEEYKSSECCHTAYLTITNGKATWQFIIDSVITGFQPPEACDDFSNGEMICTYTDTPMQVLGYSVNRTIIRSNVTGAVVQGQISTPGKYPAFGRVGIDNEYTSSGQPKYILWYMGTNIEQYLKTLDSITLSLKTT
jgi:hypothetical protein